MQALYAMAIEPVAETKVHNFFYGFTKGRSTADAMDKKHHYFQARFSPEWVLR